MTGSASEPGISRFRVWSSGPSRNDQSEVDAPIGKSRHGRACPGHPRLPTSQPAARTSMPAQGRARRNQFSIRACFVRFPAGLHETEAFFDLAEHNRKILALLRGEAGKDLLLPALQPRDQLLVQRLALSCHAQLELAA